MSARPTRSIFRSIRPVESESHSEEKKQDVHNDTSIGGIPIHLVPQAVSAMNDDSLKAFLSRVSPSTKDENHVNDADGPADIDEDVNDADGEVDAFSKLVQLCARNELHGPIAIAKLLHHFQEYGHPEYAIFSIQETITNNEKLPTDYVAAFLSGNEGLNKHDGRLPAVAGVLDASGSMDQVADSIQHLVEKMSFVPIWSCFSAKVNIVSSPLIHEKMGIHTKKKSCTLNLQSVKKQSDVKFYRFASCHGVSHTHMTEMTRYRERNEEWGYETSLFRYQTSSKNIFNLAWSLYHAKRPYCIVIIGDGKFDESPEELSQLLTENSEAFGLCRKIIFASAPHITDEASEQLTEMFSQFVRTTEGCMFTMLRPKGRDDASMEDLARQIQEEVACAESMVNIPGYKVLMGESAPIYLPHTDRNGMNKAIRMCPDPDLVWNLAKVVIQVVSDRHTISRIEKDPLFSMIYGSLVSLKYHDLEDLRKVSEWIRTELSRLKLEVLNSIKYAQPDSIIRASHMVHCTLLDKLIDDSKRNPMAFMKATKELGDIVERERDQGHTIYALKTMKQYDSSTIKAAIRQIGAEDARIKAESELHDVLRNLYTKEESTDDDDLYKNEERIQFSIQSPYSIKLALSLLFSLHGVNDVLVTNRPLLLISLRLCYEMKVGTALDRDGIDPTLVLLAREHLANFCDHSSVLGLEKEDNDDNNEFYIKEFLPFMNNPSIMRLLLRGHRDYNLIPCADLLDILRNFIKARALLDLLNGSRKHGVTLDIKTKVYPPDLDSNHFTFHKKYHYLPTYINDDRVQSHKAPKVRDPRKKKWRRSMSYDEWMDELGVPPEKRRVLKSFHPDEWMAPLPARPFIEKMQKSSLDGIDAMAPSLLGIGLKMHLDGSVECTTSAWTCVDFQRLVLEDGSLEPWAQYWRRNQISLIRTLKYQHNIFMTYSLVQGVRNNWGQRGWVAVFLEGFPPEAESAYPVYDEGVLQTPFEDNHLHPESLVMSKSSVHQRFRAASAGEVEQMPDSYTVTLPWRLLLGLPGMPEALGLNPHVIQLLMDKDRVTGTRLKFDLAPELLERYDALYEMLPSEDKEWNISFVENFITHLYKVRVKGQCDIKFGSTDFRYIRNELQKQLEGYMKVSFALRHVDDEDAIATCWICAEDERVTNRDFWVDLSCCGQALCVSCFDNSTRIDELPLRLFPQCPFCNAELDVTTMLNRFTDGEDEVLRGDRLSWLQNHVIDPSRLGPNRTYHTVTEARDLSKTHRFSTCRECDGAIATRRNCAARLNDLPNMCSPCINALPSELNIQRCPTCEIPIERIDGCNSVHCTSCNHSMCWVCGAAVGNHDRDHFIHGFFGNRCINSERHQQPQQVHRQEVRHQVAHQQAAPMRRRRRRRRRLPRLQM